MSQSTQRICLSFDSIGLTLVIRIRELINISQNDIRMSDSAAPGTNAWTRPAYSYGTNITLSITNLQTNGIFMTDTSTNTLIQTNIYISGNYRTNVSVAAAVVAFPDIYSVWVPANTTTDSGSVDFIITRGITVMSTNAVTAIVYTVP